MGDGEWIGHGDGDGEYGGGECVSVRMGVMGRLLRVVLMVSVSFVLSLP